MGDGRGPGDERAVDEHRHGENDVVEMRDPAVVRIVDGEHVAGREARGTVLAQDRLHRLVEHADERGNAGAGCGDLAVGVGDAGAEIEHLVDDRAHRRLAHRGEHLVGDGLERVLDDVESDGVVDRLHQRPHRAISIWMLP